MTNLMRFSSRSLMSLPFPTPLSFHCMPSPESSAHLKSLTRIFMMHSRFSSPERVWTACNSTYSNINVISIGLPNDLDYCTYSSLGFLSGILDVVSCGTTGLASGWGSVLWSYGWGFWLCFYHIYFFQLRIKIIRVDYNLKFNRIRTTWQCKEATHTLTYSSTSSLVIHQSENHAFYCNSLIKDSRLPMTSPLESNLALALSRSIRTTVSSCRSGIQLAKKASEASLEATIEGQFALCWSMISLENTRSRTWFAG